MPTRRSRRRGTRPARRDRLAKPVRHRPHPLGCAVCHDQRGERGTRGATGPDCTNAPREGGTRAPDTLVRIRQGAYYGHPNPSRGECGPATYAPLATFPGSTDGLAEVPAGPLAGDLLTASLDGTLYRLRLDDTASHVVAREAVKLGGVPLDVTVEGKDDPLPGTIWVALYNDARGNPGGLAVLEPARRNIGPWTTLAGTGSPRQEVSYVAYGGRLFLAGGGTRQQVFDPRTGTWSDVAPLPESLDHIQGAVVGDKIYYVGGLRSWPNDEVGTVYVYDPALNRFSRGPTMPRPRGAGGVAVHDGKIYYAGGLHRGRAVPWLDVLDPAAGHWSQLPDMPRPRDHFQAVFAGDRMLVTGGRNRDIGTEIADTDAYDVSERRWVTGLAPLPTPRGGFGAVFVHGEMLVIGGEVPGRVLPRSRRMTWPGTRGGRCRRCRRRDTGSRPLSAATACSWLRAGYVWAEAPPTPTRLSPSARSRAATRRLLPNRTRRAPLQAVTCSEASQTGHRSARRRSSSAPTDGSTSRSRTGRFAPTPSGAGPQGRSR